LRKIVSLFCFHDVCLQFRDLLHIASLPLRQTTFLFLVDHITINSAQLKQF